MMLKVHRYTALYVALLRIRVYNSLMEFECDIHKSRSNHAKHGIDFETGKKLFTDANGMVLSARFRDEERWFFIGELDGLMWTAIFTYRGEAIRIISIRRSRQDEKDLYHG
jgi:uncharacterized DUF497 family protein